MASKGWKKKWRYTSWVGVRMKDDMRDQLERLSVVRQEPVSDVIRAAIDLYIQREIRTGRLAKEA